VTLRDIADGLDKAERQGANKDDPEGSRFIILSDTLAKIMSEAIRRHLV
jgi:hypothetical protein